MQSVFYLNLISCVSGPAQEENNGHSIKPKLETLKSQGNPAEEESSSASSINHPLNHSQQAWFRGGVAEAFNKARDEKKSLFLYWGAQWCPPCNELKSSVFNQEAFWQEMSGNIAVYLDGDSVEAQKWGEKLDVSGYPTLLFLNDQGEEIFRIATGLSLEETLLLLRYLKTDIDSIEAIINKLEKGDVSKKELSLLSYLSWEQKTEFAKLDLKKIQLMEKIYQALPNTMVSERAIIAARLLEYWSASFSGENKGVRNWAQTQDNNIFLWFEAMTHNADTIFASRVSLIYAIDSIYPNMKKSLSSSQTSVCKEKWLAALESLSLDPRLNIDAQFWSRLGELGFYQAQTQHHANNNNVKVAPATPKSLQKKVIATVAWVNKVAQSPEERTAVMPGASVALYDAGLPREAEELLKREAKISPTPFYYYSTLASFAKKVGDIPQAKIWARLAKETAVGTATKIQWMALELNLNLETLNPETAKNTTIPVALLQDYYKLAFSLEDGFLGRNGNVSERVARNLKPFVKMPAFSSVINRYYKNCAGSSEEQIPHKSGCDRHFTIVLSND